MSHPIPSPGPYAPNAERLPPMDRPQPSVTVRAVLENDARSITEGLTLARSLRAFGGALSTSPCELFFVETIPDDVDAFDRLDVTLRTCGRFDERCPHANKLGMLLPVETDYLLAVDADIVVCEDVSPYLLGDAVAAMPAWGDWMPPGRWEELFADAGVDMPRDRIITTRFWQETIPYYNGGVVITPREHVEALADSWVEHVRHLLDAADSRPWWGRAETYFLDQLALALVMGGDLPRRDLPIEMNWMLHCADLPEHLGLASRRPLLMHTTHRMDYTTGRILDAPYPHCQAAVERYNALLGT